MESAASAVLVRSAPLAANTVTVEGPAGLDTCSVSSLLSTYGSIGYQATHFGRACAEVNRALATPECTIFLGVAANLLATGVREALVVLARHRQVDCVVASAGGCEHDLRRALMPAAYTVASYASEGAPALGGPKRKYFGNVAMDVAADAALDAMLQPLLRRLYDEQRAAERKAPHEPELWVCSPSRFWRRIGELLPDAIGLAAAETTVVYWAAKHGIPIYSPNFADGDVALPIASFHAQLPPSSRRLVVDLVGDIGLVNKTAIRAVKSAVIVLGGGVVKHHVCNANLFRNGADFAVFINTAQEFDGSDAGARPDEAVSWGKIALSAHPVKIYGEAALVFPLLFAQTFLARLRTGIARGVGPQLPLTPEATPVAPASAAAAA